MHRAPAVSFPVVRSRWHLLCIGAFGVLSVMGSLAFSAQPAVWGWRHTALVAAIVTGTGAALFEWLRTPTGLLRWDGSQWLWDAGVGEVPCAVQLGLDCQSALVLRLAVSGGRTGYRWLEAAAAPDRWLALRRAVVSSALHPPTPADLDGHASTGGRA